MTVVPRGGGLRSGAGSWLQMPKSSSNSAVSRTPASSNCFCLIKIVRPRCMAFLPFSLFTPGLLPLSAIHLHVAGRGGFCEVRFYFTLFVWMVSHLPRSTSVLFLTDEREGGQKTDIQPLHE